MRIKISNLALSVIISSVFTTTPDLEPAIALQTGKADNNSSTGTQTSPASGPKHSKLRKYAAIAGVGLLTGGIGGVLLGTGLVHGAVMGAGSHVALHEAKEKYKAHKGANKEKNVEKENVEKENVKKENMKKENAAKDVEKDKSTKGQKY